MSLLNISYSHVIRIYDAYFPSSGKWEDKITIWYQQEKSINEYRNKFTAIPRGFQLEHKKKWLEWFFNSATQQR